MDDDVDFDDLLGEERVVESMTTKRPINDQPSPPSANELRLGRRVLELEKERDALAAELSSLRSAQSQSTSEPLLLPSPAQTPGPIPPITIPHALLPVLGVLRRHVEELARENAALRYTFLGPPGASATAAAARASPASVMRAGVGSGSSTVPSAGLGSVDQASIDDGAMRGAEAREQGVDLDKVVQRVKAIMLENEELGAMVVEGGKLEGQEAEWQKALDESKAVIQSLDSDLTHHLSTIQTLRAELHSAKSTPAPPSVPVQAQHRPSHGHSHGHSKQPSISSASGSGVGSGMFGPPRAPSASTNRQRPPISSAASTGSVGSGHGQAHGSVKMEPGISGGRGGAGQMGSGGSGRVVPGSAPPAPAPAPPTQGLSMAERIGTGKHREVEKEPPKGPREDRDVKRRR
ncbi:uncharacterized protein MKK02DRAFT_41869 [Dioszegia hungarica]|uniref:Uncharacterized protein n=1 Tax=Dioszegia hungarica TaxID=4972 RepID=A0AA38HH11_9TREE|nr:uncharacterized protein MKK02DRAFT_41869 [Dioszegia hungarica]KAI9638844.1 hypothetical protein MKK02DRAFT_41869 [Dioszegia hungarica]